MYRLAMGSRVRERETLRTLDVTNAVGGGTVPVYVPGTLGTVDALDHLGTAGALDHLGTDDHLGTEEGLGPLHRTEGGGPHQGGDIHLALEVAHHPGVLLLVAQPPPLATPLPERDLLESTDAGPDHHGPLDLPDIEEGPHYQQDPALLSQHAPQLLDLLLL